MKQTHCFHASDEDDSYAELKAQSSCWELRRPRLHALAPKHSDSKAATGDTCAPGSCFHCGAKEDTKEQANL